MQEYKFPSQRELSGFIACMIVVVVIIRGFSKITTDTAVISVSFLLVGWAICRLLETLRNISAELNDGDDSKSVVELSVNLTLVEGISGKKVKFTDNSNQRSDDG